MFWPDIDPWDHTCGCECAHCRLLELQLLVTEEFWQRIRPQR